MSESEKATANDSGSDKTAEKKTESLSSDTMGSIEQWTPERQRRLDEAAKDSASIFFS